MSKAISNDTKRKIYIRSRTFVDDEQFYILTFSTLFIFVSCWALSSKFKPVDTVGVFLALSLLLLIMVGFRWKTRADVKTETLVATYTDALYTEKPKDRTGWTKVFTPFEWIWYYFMDQSTKRWSEFEKMHVLDVSLVPMPDAQWTKLETMIKEDDEWNRKLHKMCTYGGTLAILGTILRLHGTNKNSNTSGTIVVLLYEIVFTLYCSWQLLFHEQKEAITQCQTTFMSNYDSLAAQQRQGPTSQNYYSQPLLYNSNFLA